MIRGSFRPRRSWCRSMLPRHSRSFPVSLFAAVAVIPLIASSGCGTRSSDGSGDGPDRTTGGGTTSGGGGNDGGGPPAGGAATDAGGTANSGSGGESPGPGGGGPSSGGNSAVDFLGRVQVYRSLATGPRSEANAYFTTREATDSTADCTSTPYGECTLRICPPREVDPNEPPALRWDAGVITVVDNESAEDDLFSATLTPSGDDRAYKAEITSSSLGGGETITVTAEGGSISAFQVTLQLPLAPLLTSHPVTPTEEGPIVKVPVARDADLHLTFDMRETGARIQSAFRGPDSTVNLSCDFSANRGTGVIAAAALAELPAGSAIHFFSVESKDVISAEGKLTVLAFFEMVSPDRTAYPMFVVE